MKIYLNPEKWAERLKSVPAPLRRKQLKDLDSHYEKIGFRPTGKNGTDENGNFSRVSIRPGTDLKAVYDFLQSIDAAAVSLEPEDVQRILGRSPITLGIQRHMEIEGVPESVSVIEPDQLADGIAELRRSAMRGTDAPLTDEQRDFIETDLMQNGFLDEKEETANDKWLEPAKQEMGLRLGQTSGRYDFDNALSGEWALDEDVEDWNEGEL